MGTTSKARGEVATEDRPTPSPKACPRTLVWEDLSLGMGSLGHGSQSTPSKMLWDRDQEHKGSKTTSLALRILIQDGKT